MPPVIDTPIESLTLVVPVAPQKETTIASLLKEASAANLQRIHQALAPGFTEILAQAPQRQGPFVRLIAVPRMAFDNGAALRVVNVAFPKDLGPLSCIYAGQPVADLLGAPVRIERDGVFLTAYGQDLLLQPQESPVSEILKFTGSHGYEKAHGSLFDGPDGAAHRKAAALNGYHRVFLWGDPQKTPAPALPATAPMAHVSPVDNADFD